MSGGAERAPRVSLVLATYDARPDWLRLAVRGALDDFDDSELVIVDDGSEVPVDQLLADLGDDRLRIIRTENRGHPAARNTGMAHARGRFLRFIDDDDLILPASTRRLLTHSAGTFVGYGATVMCDSALRPQWVMSCDVQGWGAEAALLARFTTRISAFIFPASVVERVGEWSDMPLSEDWDFILRALEQAPAPGDRIPSYIYRRHPAGLTSNVEGSVKASRAVVARYFDRHPEDRERLGGPTEATALAQAARAHLTRRKLLPGIRLAIRALRIDPGAVAFQIRFSLQAIRGRIRTRLGAGRAAARPGSEGH